MNVTVDGVPIDMDASQVGISYAIGDPLEPGTIAGTRSTTFKMPATNRVRAAMGGPSMNERPIQGDPVLRIGNGGNVYLEQVIRPIEWDEDEVRAVTVGNNASWIADLKNLKLPDLDLGESPRIAESSFTNSWTDEESLTYFPLIDYGYPWDTVVAAEIEDFRPGFRCHVLLKKAFGLLGYSVKVTGKLATIWKKFVLPCTNNVVVGDRFITENALRMEQDTNSITDFTAVVPRLKLPVFVEQIMDPSNSVFNTNEYLSQFDMELSAKFSITLEVISGESDFSFYLYDPGTNNPISAPYGIHLAAGQIVTLTDINLGVHDVNVADRLAVGLFNTFIANNVQINITSCVVTISPVNIEYQENITVNLDSCVPRISAWDVLQGINYSRLLAFDTDDRTKVVTISYDEDKYRPISEGLSLVGREDFTDKPVKGNPLKAKRLVFEWDEDKDDFYLTKANTNVGERGWGGLIRDIEGGTLKEKRIKMPFAATAMRVYPGDLFIPVMREQEVRAVVPGEEDRNFERTPRLLLADGVAFSEVDGWTLGAAPFSVYPKCFFVRPGETDLCMSFGPETLHGTSGPGTVALHYGPYLRRLEKSFTYSIDLMLYDHEMKGLDFGVPVEVRDKFGTGWYYFTEIKRKQFGKDVPTRCDLIQV